MTGKANYTNSKRDQILSLLGTLKFEEHTYQDKGYEFLEVDSTFITVYNPNNEERLSIELGEEFRLFFGGWQTRYDATDDGYFLFVNAVKGILSSLLSVYILELEDGIKHELAETFTINDIKEVAILIPTFKKCKLKNAKIKIYTWNGHKG